MLRLLIAAVALVVAAVQLRAYELLRVGRTCDENSQFLFWQPPTARIDYAGLALEYQREVEQARQRWNESLLTFHFDFGSGTFCDVADGISTLGFSRTDCGGASLGDTLAVTRLRWEERSGRLLDADVVFNENRLDLLGNLAIFRQVAMHELGHVLGLDHSDACGKSGAGTLMRSFLDPNERRIERPTQDDIEGANFIYGSAAGGPVPEGANSCAIVHSPLVPRTAILFLLAPILLVIGRWLSLRSVRGRDALAGDDLVNHQFAAGVPGADVLDAK
jgi:hypothetical protein